MDRDEQYDASGALRILGAIDGRLWDHAWAATVNVDDAHSYHTTLQRQFAEHITKQFLESRHESRESSEAIVPRSPMGRM